MAETDRINLPVPNPNSEAEKLLFFMLVVAAAVMLIAGGMFNNTTCSFDPSRYMLKSVESSNTPTAALVSAWNRCHAQNEDAITHKAKICSCIADTSHSNTQHMCLQ